MKSRFDTFLKVTGQRVLLILGLMLTYQGWSANDHGPIRILFLGQNQTLHNSNLYYPMLAKALGRDAIYFDYSTDVATALDPEYLNQFDGLLLYANHEKITPEPIPSTISEIFLFEKKI